MSKAVGLDRAVEYVEKLEKFRMAFQKADRGCQDFGETVQIETGRKFDKVYVQTSVQKLGRYMVDRNSWVIYGIKSWAQINERRTYGTLDTVEQYDWSAHYGIPKAGTDAEKLHNEREAEFAKKFKPRGRPRKNP
ncbi:MAG: hypothetical protein FJ211_10675 [Ignavibacteria bacterium]|nr:hypothetical protein [Ignavibacteria bacterium]